MQTLILLGLVSSATAASPVGGILEVVRESNVDITLAAVFLSEPDACYRVKQKEQNNN